MKRFSVRDLFWLVLLAAVLCGWWIDRRGLVNEVADWRRRSVVERQEAERRLKATTNFVTSLLLAETVSDESQTQTVDVDAVISAASESSSK